MLPEDTGLAARANLELMYHISRELAAAIELPLLLQRILPLAIESVNATSGSIIVLDEAGHPLETAFYLQGHTPDATTVKLDETFEHGLAGWVARHCQAVLITDTSRDERWLRRPDDDVSQTGAKSAISVPILVREQLVGVMTLVHPGSGTLNEGHLALVQAIADQAGIGILNARLYTESQLQARVMTAVAESAAVITATLDLDEVLFRILEQVSHALNVAVASLALITSDGRELEFRASTHRGKSSVVGLRLPLGQGIAGWVAQEGRGLLVPDAYQDPRFYVEIDRVTNFRTRSVVCAPIRSRGQVIGIMEAINPLSGAFNRDALQVLTGIGSLAGTAIRHAQLFERLQAALKRYHDLFDDSIDAIFLTDLDGLIIEGNRQAMNVTGLLGDALRGLPIHKLHSVALDQLGLNFEKVHGGETITYESVLNSQGGREIPVQVYVRRVLMEGIWNLQWTFHDITERKNLDNLRNDLLSMVYHDLRSPLTNIVSSLDVMSAMVGQQQGETLRSLLGIAARSTERIQRLTNSLLDLNRLEAGQPITNRQQADVSNLVRDAIDVVTHPANSKGITIHNRVPELIPAVLMDPEMIRRVMINLLENAIKFTPQKGQIRVGAKTDGAFVRIWVADSGPGILPQDRERIFDKYTRLHAKEGPRGLGLGLAYCRLAVEGHDGRIWVEDASPSGSCFIFLLPVAPEEPLADNTDAK